MYVSRRGLLLRKPTATVTMSLMQHCCYYVSDKLCDQISDAVLDAHLAQDPDAKVACGECSCVSLHYKLPHNY